MWIRSMLDKRDCSIKRESSIAMDKSIADSFIRYLSMPLYKQNTKLGTMDARFTPQAFNSIKPMTSIYDASNTNLIKFHTLGGKIIVCHGYSDPSIGQGTIAYYNAIVKKMGGLDTIQKFARLFMLPRVYRCGEGCGTSHFHIVTAITT